MKLIVGLGNPDKEYSDTRHNIGFNIVDSYVGIEKWQSKFESLYCEKRIDNEKVLFIKPQTFMNNSGIAVAKFVNYYDIKAEDILIIQDDLDLAVGKYKLKQNSSSGGHNGIRSILMQLGTDAFPRLKVGISHSVSGNTVMHVLGKISKEEKKILEELQPIFNTIIDSFITSGISNTMNLYNKRD